MIFGESESGKTALLRLLIKQITERYTPQQGRIIMVDYRRTLLGVVPDSHLVEFAASAPALEQFTASMRSALSARVPTSEVTQEQLRNRSLVDRPGDVRHRRRLRTGRGLRQPAGRSAGPAALLQGHRAARDPGPQHGGRLAQPVRVLHEPAAGAGNQGVLLSGDRDEGALLGNVKPTRLPPGRGFHVTRRRGSQLIQTARVGS